MNLIYSRPGEPKTYLVTAAEIAGSDADLNAALPDAEPGTVIATAGYTAMKQKAADGAWVSI